jgi:hypothetical protein
VGTPAQRDFCRGATPPYYAEPRPGHFGTRQTASPVGSTAPSRPNWVRDNQSHPAVRRRVHRQSCGTLGSTAGSITAPARGDYSSIPTQLGSRQSEPPRRATPSVFHWQPVRSTIPLYFASRHSSTPWFHHRATRGDYSPNAAPARVTEPPRRVTPSESQGKKRGTLWALTLPAHSTLRGSQRHAPWKPPPTEKTVLEKKPHSHVNWSSLPTPPPISPGRTNLRLLLPE